MQQFADVDGADYVIRDICNPFATLTNDFFRSNFGVNKTTTTHCSPGCMDYYYDDLQFFNGITSRSRETLFFSNYTHLVNTIYPLPAYITKTANPNFGLWGDRHHRPSEDIKPSKQATNFTGCPAIWHVFKVEAAVYPIDNSFNMCGDEGFHTQSFETSIDCASTENVGFAFMAVGAGTLVAMYFAAFFVVYFKGIQTPTFFSADMKVDVKIEESSKLKTIGLYHGFDEIPLKPTIETWIILLKDYVLFLVTPFVEAADVVLDGIYVVKMARALNRFWISASIIRLMLKVYIISVVKDIILNLLFVMLFFGNTVALSPQKTLAINMLIKIVGFFTEDTAQSVLQYFYFEKYQLYNDVSIIMKFVIGLLVVLKSLNVLRGAASEVGWKHVIKRDMLLVIVYVLLTIVPFLRFIGLIIQARRGQSLIRAGCLEYRISFDSQPNFRTLESYEVDYQTHHQWDDFYTMARDQGKFFNENNSTMKRLNVTPFNSQCMIAIDYVYLIGI